MKNVYSCSALGGKDRFLRKIVPLFCFLTITLSAYAQKFDFNFKNVSFAEAMNQIATKADVQFVFDAKMVKTGKPLNLILSGENLTEVLDKVFQYQQFSYSLNGKIITLKPKSVVAQEFIVRGSVVDSTGQPLPGVAVRVKGTNKSTSSDVDGKFIISLTSLKNIVEFSYLGYKHEEKTFDAAFARGLVRVVLSPSSSALSSVVVTGYQSLKREDTPGSFVNIDVKKLNENLNTDLLSALEGRVSGLLYQKNPNGQGSDEPVLRGISTYSTSSGMRTPLLVIDGLPTEYTMDQINPYDVESVTVLKDAAATSIYGSRATAGVIVITTRKGSGGVKINFNADAFITGKPDLSKLHYASTQDLIAFENDVYAKERARYASTAAMFNSYGNVNQSSVKYYSPLYQLNRDLEEGTVSQTEYDHTISVWGQNDYMRDYSKYVWQNQFRQRYNFSVSSGNSKSNSYVSLNYDKSKERIIKNDNQNFNLYAKSTFQLNSWLNASFGINGTLSTANLTDNEFNSFDIQPRYAQITDNDGNRVYADYVGVNYGNGAINGAIARTINANPTFKSYSFNVLDALEEGIEKQRTEAIRAFADLKIRFTPWLSLGTQFQFENRRNSSESYYDVDSYRMRHMSNTLTYYTASTGKYASALPTGGRYYQLERRSQNYTFRNQLNFDKTFDDNRHIISAIAGMEMRESFSPRSVEQLRYGYDPITLTSTNYDNNALSETGITSYIYATRKTLSSLGRSQSEIKHRFFSLYSNLNYTYNRKYNLSGSVRVDQADMFGVDPKYKRRPLWSVGLGWNASNENFLQEVKWIDLLKLRATYGVTGNVNSDSSPFITARRRNDNLYPTLQYTDVTAFPNPKLRWEKTATTNIGIDFGLFHRLNGSIEFYNRKSTDLLTTTDLDPTVGVNSLVINSGTLRNRGVELTLGGTWFNKGDLSLSTTFILAINQNRVKETTRAAATAGSYVSSPSNYFLEGDTYNSLYAYRYAGMENGYPYFYDQNNLPSIQFDANGNPITSSIKSINDVNALVNMGSLTPTRTGSVSQRIAYRQWDMGFLLVFSGGNVMRKDVMSLSSNDVRDEDIVRQRYKNGAISAQPRLLVDMPTSLDSYATTVSGLWQGADINVLKADYVKLRNLSVGYNVNPSLVKKVGLNSAKLTLQVNNLWYHSAAGDDIDPETYSLNNGTRSIPAPKSFLFGLSIGL